MLKFYYLELSYEIAFTFSHFFISLLKKKNHNNFTSYVQICVEALDRLNFLHSLWHWHLSLKSTFESIQVNSIIISTKVTDDIFEQFIMLYVFSSINIYHKNWSSHFFKTSFSKTLTTIAKQWIKQCPIFHYIINCK